MGCPRGALYAKTDGMSSRGSLMPYNSLLSLSRMAFAVRCWGDLETIRSLFNSVKLKFPRLGGFQRRKVGRKALFWGPKCRWRLSANEQGSTGFKQVPLVDYYSDPLTVKPAKAERRTWCCNSSKSRACSGPYHLSHRRTKKKISLACANSSCHTPPTPPRRAN
jgi:hypothetical protein